MSNVRKWQQPWTKHASVEEQVAKTLYILSCHAKNWEVQFWFHCFGETTSDHFSLCFESHTRVGG